MIRAAPPVHLKAIPVLFEKLLADTGREPSHAAVVREHGVTDRSARGGDWVAGGRRQPAKSGNQDVEVGDVFVEITDYPAGLRASRAREPMAYLIAERYTPCEGVRE